MRQANALEKMREKLVPGQVYRRTEFRELSSNFDRYLARLVKLGELTKLQYGLYLCPQKSTFGKLPPEQDSLLKTFLKDDHFVVYSPSDFNALGFGTTQLYNKRIVFNRKRSGEFELGGRRYHFYRWREAPKSATKEFLFVEMVNRLDELAEDREAVLSSMKKKMHEFNKRKLLFALKHYGTYSTQLKFKELNA